MQVKHVTSVHRAGYFSGSLHHFRQQLLFSRLRQGSLTIGKSQR